MMFRLLGSSLLLKINQSKSCQFLDLHHHLTLNEPKCALIQDDVLIVLFASLNTHSASTGTHVLASLLFSSPQIGRLKSCQIHILHY
jgi:hypothetical protein